MLRVKDKLPEVSMFFFSNVSDKKGGRLCLAMGIHMTKKIGKYLGHHIVLTGRDRERHRDLLKRIQSKVEGWKLKCLSRDGQLTLA